MISTPSLDEYAVFLDCDVEDLSTYAVEALTQGVDLFWLATSIVADPTDAQPLRMQQRAVLAAAEAMEAAKGYRASVLSPFTAETIGSYSYEKMFASVRGGVPTGLLWFDVAVSYFKGGDDIVNTATELFDRPEPDLTSATRVSDGSPALLGPVERAGYIQTWNGQSGVD